MSYIDVDDDNLLKDITSYKEFYQLHNDNSDDGEHSSNPTIDDAIKRGNYMLPKSYQLFGKTYINPDTPYKRLLVQHNTGSGKTANALGIAYDFINIYRQETSVGYNNIGSIFIFGFENSRRAFERELYRYAEFGFISREEVRTMNKLIKQASSKKRHDVDKLAEFQLKIRKRLSNRKHNGFFKFIGYKSFVSKLFTSDVNISGLTELKIKEMIQTGEVKINIPLLNTFENSLMICDEVHNIYNTLNKNNWGVAIQTVLDRVPTLRAVFLSATPINNSPTESIDLINLLIPENMRLDKHKYFSKTGEPYAGTLDTLAKLSVGRISYMMDVDPKYYPSKVFMGDPIQGIDYLKFTQCVMSPIHQATYDTLVTGSVPIEGQAILDMVFPNPSNDDVGIFKSSNVHDVRSAPREWKNTHNITVLDNGVIGGTYLHINNIEKYSTKYHRMISDVLQIIKSGRGKIFIYHPMVVMSGVLLISEILTRNGIIGYNDTVSDNTICTVCGNENKTHDVDKADHTFNAARHIAIHAGVDPSSISKYIDQYNTARNAMGVDIMVLVGSRIMQESREVRNTENLMVAHKPDNISSLIQIIGRVVRTNSHADLPIDRTNVNIFIYTTLNANSDKLPYELATYKVKVNEYKIIQAIEQKFHEYAIDGAINYPIVKNAFIDNGIGDLKYKPKYEFKEIPLNKLKLSTFNIYHTESELSYIIYVIKRLFLEASQVWTYPLLWDAVKRSTYKLPVNPNTFLECNFAIALNRLTYDPTTNVVIHDAHANAKKYLDRLFDPFDIRIVLPEVLQSADSVSYGYIVNINNYYMLFPVDGDTVRIDIDTQYRVSDVSPNKYINVASYLDKSSRSKHDYFDNKIKFRQNYENASLEQLGESLYYYNVDFHIRFIEECIEYIFNIWTNPTNVQSEYHAFYFKMIYYYDIVGIIVWVNGLSGSLYKSYEKYVLPNSNILIGQTKRGKLIPDTGGENRIDDINSINSMVRIISKSTCTWCPIETTVMYDTSITTALSKFADRIKSGASEDIVKVDSSMLPAGHLLREVGYYYLPSGWYSSDELTMQKNWVDNDVVIGYSELTKGGMSVKFKLRGPTHTMKNIKDARKIHSGVTCDTMNKTVLYDIAKKLKLPIKKTKVHTICNDIKTNLIMRDILERQKNTNIRWYYNFWESNTPSKK